MSQPCPTLGDVATGTGGLRRAGRRSTLPPIKALDFFCGAGGLTRGLLDAGIRVKAGIDNDGRLKKTYEHNNKPSKFVEQDINDVDIGKLRQDCGITPGDLVLYAACTPCQPFSSLNQLRLGGGTAQARQDDRKELLLQFGQLVRESPPDFVVVENVPGLNNAYGRKVYQRFLQDLDAAGLQYRDDGQLDAQDFGVPQVRKRFLLIASRHGEITLPQRRAKRTTVRAAIGDLPPPRIGIEGGGSRSAPSAGADLDGVPPNHVARQLQPHHEQIVAAVPADGGSRSDITDDSVLLDCHKRNPKLHRDVFGRMSWDRPAPTLTCRCTDVYCGRFVHPEEDRGLTLREAAALQSFPNHYVFHGTFFHASQQIGNAVPVRLARRLGRQVKKAAAAMAISDG